LKLIEVSVKRPIGVLMIVIAVVSLGLFSLRSLAVDLFPKIDLPIAVVATSYAGAAPEEVEKLVSSPLEGAMGSIQGIDTIQSQSQVGASMIIMQFKTGTNLDNALLEVREKVDQVKGMLPEDANDPSVLRFDPQQMPILTLSLSGQDAAILQNIAEDTVVPFLERQKGVASVSVQGGKTREIRVELDQAKMQQYGIGASQVIQAIGAENRSASVGSVQKGAEEQQIRVLGEYASLADLENTLIHLQTGATIKVGDVAVIRDTFAEQTSLSYVNGEPALLLSVQKQSDANTVEAAEAVTAALEKLKADLPENTSLNVTMDTSEIINQSINSVVNNMLTGAVLSVIVLLLFLRNVRSTLVISLSIPIAVIATFTLMYFSGQTLNIISMGGLALGVGMMVDSSIVILENIFSHRQRGYSVKDAAVKGASELGSAVIASTVTTLVVFLPMTFVQGLAADIFTPMALSVTFSLIASLVVAITLVPTLSSKMLARVKLQSEKKENGLDRFGGRILAAYRKALRWVLSHRKTTVSVTLVLLIGSFALTPFIGAEFMPASDQGQFQITVETPSGTSLEETKKTTDDITELLTPYEAILESVNVSVGGSNDGLGGSANTATVSVELIPSGERDVSTTEVVQAIDAGTDNIAGAEITVSEVQTGLGGGSAIQIGISGQDYDVLKELGDQVVWSLADIKGIYNPKSSASSGGSEMNIVVNRDIAAHYGLTYQQVMSEISVAMKGQVATRYREGGDEIDVKVTLPEDTYADLSALNRLTLRTPGGELIPLSVVADFEQVQGPVMIQRENQQRQINITSDVVGRDLGSVSGEVTRLLAGMNFPDGYSYSFGGQSQDMMESFADLGAALLFAIVLVYIVMAVQFESLLHPFVIMFSLPTTIIGVLLGLFVTRTPLSITVLIGLIMLAGIVVNNAIILVDYVNTLRGRGLEREEAILEGAPSRVRPIFMTTATTVLGLLPLAFGIGEGAEMQAPMAITVIFGLSFSTLLTLFFVPVMYTIADNMSNWFGRVVLRRKPETDVPVNPDGGNAAI